MTHTVYASILRYSGSKTIISNMADLNQAREFVINDYDEKLEEVQNEAIEIAYENVFNQHPKVSEVLSQAGTLKYVGGFKAIGEFSMQVLMKAKRSIFPENGNSNLEEINDMTILAPVNNIGIIIDGRCYANVLEYVYFSYYYYFIRDGNKAYDALRKSGDVETTFSTLQTEYLDKTVNYALRMAIKYKFSNDEEAMITLKSVVAFHVEHSGSPDFLRAYIEKYSMKYIMLAQRNLPIFIEKYPIIDMGVFHNDAFLTEWVFKYRLPDILYTINVIYSYLLQKEIHPESLKMLLKVFYSQCKVTNMKMFISGYTTEFFEQMKKVADKINKGLWRRIAYKKNGHHNIYLIWTYISVLLLRLGRYTGVTFDIYYGDKHEVFMEAIAGFMENVPKTFTVIDVYAAVSKILYSLKRVCNACEFIFKNYTGGNECNTEALTNIPN